MELKGKLALVTGAASGIGAAVTRLFVQRGAHVFATDMNQAKLDELASALGGAIVPYEADISERVRVEQMVATAIKTLGGLDILINNAGIGSVGRAADLDPDEWRKVFAVDLDAVFLASRMALPKLIERRGNIVCTASISGLSGDYGFTAYNAAKAGLLGLVRNMAVDYAAQGVRVNAVSPGITITPMSDIMPEASRAAFAAAVPMRRAGKAEEIAEAIAFLASDRASYVTGQNLVVDGGLMAHTGQPDIFALRAARG